MRINFKACPITPLEPFPFRSNRSGLQIPDLARFLDANRFLPRIKQRIPRAWHGARFRLPLSSRRRMAESKILPG
jgi:hypothetical protein